MNSRATEVVLASVPDREDLVAKIWIEGSQLAEVRRDGHEFLVEVYPHSSGAIWHLRHCDLIDLLNAAKQKIAGAIE